MKRILLFCVLVFPLLAEGQAIRLNIYGQDYFRITSEDLPFAGIGYEQNIGSRISLTLEFNADYGGNENIYQIYRFIENNIPYQLSYNILSHYKEFAYQSKFFLGQTAGTAVYIGPGIALRSLEINSTASVQEEITYSYTSYRKSEIIQIFPLSFKMGVRGPLDGLYMDLSVGLTYLPNAAKITTKCDPIDKYIGTPHFNKLSFNFCITLGIGWAD